MNVWVCVYCAEPVAPSQAHQRIRGWEKRGTAATRRHGSDIILRERVDEYACQTCIARLRVGVPLEQEKLL